MTFSLAGLTFNHDPASSSVSALNIRLNAIHEVSTPEWLPDRAVQFPAAYSISDTTGARVEVRADLTGDPNARVEMRAIPASPFIPNVLGPTATVRVNFPPNGIRRNVGFPLLGPLFRTAGVGAHDAAWRWQVRAVGPGPWHDFDVSAHRIYVVLREPTLPWTQQPFTRQNTQLPWAEVLEWACRWAALSQSVDRAAAAITFQVFQLGAIGCIAYDCTGGSFTNYAYPEFDCTSFLARLAGGYGRGPRVNCSDCATMVSTFANCVGADLWQSQMFNIVAPFQCNLTRLIGAYFFGAVCGAGLFNYHEVAWEGACSDIEDVYDACLEVLAPPPPLPSLAPFLPADVAFGWAPGCYRDLLVAPASRPLCQAQPQTRQRRMVY